MTSINILSTIQLSFIQCFVSKWCQYQILSIQKGDTFFWAYFAVQWVKNEKICVRKIVNDVFICVWCTMYIVYCICGYGAIAKFGGETFIFYFWEEKRLNFNHHSIKLQTQIEMFTLSDIILCKRTQKVLNTLPLNTWKGSSSIHQHDTHFFCCSSSSSNPYIWHFCMNFLLIN